jgi:hypothetical protein
MLKDAEKGAYHNSHMCSLSIPSARVIPAIFARTIAANELRIGTEILLGFVFVSESDKVVTTAITDPRTVNQSPTGAIMTPNPTPPSTTQPSTSTAVDPVQSTLLALLSQAANAGAAPIK